ncbi:hypothetical protein [Spirosoma rhododendri]|uniref:Uncharacterized protein n=1 Tax=Spirosoma rhododendri TaxID=2728024 RepID=A0A7L5DN83_9BACT|nr:hypothetical protein [Spirosoma rhododendri]QJD79565.1 hypothetical protein HH216_14940 [Spirosoma rhododendri]
MESFLLLFIALVLALLFFPAGILTTLIRSLIRWKRVSFSAYIAQAARSLALSIDRMGNVVCSDLLELTMTRDTGNYLFGNSVETISLVLGMNKHLGTLTRFGTGLAWLLNLIDPGHVERAAGMPIIPPPDPSQVLIRAFLKQYWKPALAFAIGVLTVHLILYIL